MKLKTIFTLLGVTTLTGAIIYSSVDNFGVINNNGTLYIGNTENITLNKNIENNTKKENTDKKVNIPFFSNIKEEIEEVTNKNILVDLKYEHYLLQYNCDKGGYNYFIYNTVPDREVDLPRYSTFHTDYNVINKCKYSEDRVKKAKNTSSYKSPKNKPKYDRGHGVHQNIWDHDKQLMKETNYMSNIVPHQKTQNRNGLWRYSEKLTECYRDISNVFVIGGNIWGDNESNDYFWESHGVVTPDFLFKIIKIESSNNTEVFSWLIPNNPLARSSNANDFAVSISEIERLGGYDFGEYFNDKENINYNIPTLPKNCSLK